MRYSFIIGLCSLASVGLSWTNSFTLNFNGAGDTAGWSDPAANGTTFQTGVTVSSDATAYNTKPESSPGFNSTGWLQISTTQGNGIGLGAYDGTAGGGGADPTNYTIDADVFVAQDPATDRMQSGIAGRVTTTNTPFEFLYTKNNPAGATGYGYRNGGGATASAYNIFSFTESSNRWVHMRMALNGTSATLQLDRDFDNVADYSADVVLGGAALNPGKAGVFMVINNGGTLVAGQHAYFDNFKYTPAPPAAVREWDLY